MRGGRRKLSVLAEIAGPAAGDARAWSLRRNDLEALAKLQGTLEEQRLVLVSGDEGLAVALALASAASAAGRRTALLECDLSRPRLATQVGLTPVPGLHEYLRWEASAAQLLQPLVLAGSAAKEASGPLVCIVAGREAADPATLIKLESFRHALAKLRGAYDLVVLAGPAPDAGKGYLNAIAAQADTLIAAVPPAAVSGRTGRGLRAALRALPVEVRGAIVLGES
jgi:Mrp family chromosome partitioning ATPase